MRQWYYDFCDKSSSPVLFLTQLGIELMKKKGLLNAFFLLELFWTNQNKTKA